VLLSEAPLVEGTVAAAVAARGGSSLEEVAAEARGALAMKASQLGTSASDQDRPAPEHDGSASEPDRSEADFNADVETSLPVRNEIGLHARPAARFVGAATRFDAEVTVRNETTGRGPASGRSLTGLATLGVRQGHDIEVRASGPEAQAALDAIAALGPDLVILDLQMPDLDAFGVLSRLQAEDPRPSCRVLVISAALDDELQAEIMAAGADGCLSKAVSRADICSAALSLTQ
jgi:phosphotransferase system HPr (HPr) family protein